MEKHALGSRKEEIQRGIHPQLIIIKIQTNSTLHNLKNWNLISFTLPKENHLPFSSLANFI
jgi:hypothetical protein